MDYKIIIYILLAFVPGIIWLVFFMQNDKNPEPKINIFKVFYGGMISVLVAAFLEIRMLGHIDFNSADIFALFGSSTEPSLLFYGVKFVFIVGIIEETLKYLIVRFLVLKKSCIDEPIDLPIYMIAVAIGFAVGENFLLFLYKDPLNAPSIALTRFIGANLLHIICSAIIGITLALSFYDIKKRYLILFAGFSLSIITHALFDFCIQLLIINEDSIIILAPYILTGVLSILVIIGLRYVRKMKSVCRID